MLRHFARCLSCLGYMLIRSSFAYTLRIQYMNKIQRGFVFDFKLTCRPSIEYTGHRTLRRAVLRVRHHGIKPRNVVVCIPILHPANLNMEPSVFPRHLDDGDIDARMRLFRYLRDRYRAVGMKPPFGWGPEPSPDADGHFTASATLAGKLFWGQGRDGFEAMEAVAQLVLDTLILEDEAELGIVPHSSKYGQRSDAEPAGENKNHPIPANNGIVRGQDGSPSTQTTLASNVEPDIDFRKDLDYYLKQRYKGRNPRPALSWGAPTGSPLNRQWTIAVTSLWNRQAHT
ncbi:hypothetical protein FA95DRAFT_228607 [Auriscalpium vulgare]|uniref:Uncharacterized protein n=1 Tax=Auriscalpium vulgare TaxID=40419 RepID=A0ACB8RL21_9AGAM|nr:hypothetical protein FA95DRAFT_228607 [Auriscalpium vulgare]